MKKKLYIFDLDGTVVDSSHRCTLDINGEFNLDQWIKDSTRENIFKDTLLPLANFMKKVSSEGHYVWVCTARFMTRADYDYLTENGIFPSVILSRSLKDDRADHILKRRMINKLISLRPFANIERIFFDDKIDNLDALDDLMTECVLATSEQEKKYIARGFV
jgi:phosphoglycolate phosphatase-like HAD superfamily hydrolase